MSSRKTTRLLPIVMLSALAAGAIAYGDFFATSSIGTANADDGTTSSVFAAMGDSATTSGNPCEGQTWPHFTSECVASMERDDSPAAERSMRTVSVLN